MADPFKYDVTVGGKTYPIESNTELTPEEQNRAVLQYLAPPAASNPLAAPTDVPQNPAGQVEVAPQQEAARQGWVLDALKTGGGLALEAGQGVAKALDLDTPRGLLSTLALAKPIAWAGRQGARAGLAAAEAIPGIATRVTTGPLRTFISGVATKGLPKVGEILSSVGTGVLGEGVAQEVLGGESRTTQGGLQGLIQSLAPYRMVGRGLQSAGRKLTGRPAPEVAATEAELSESFAGGVQSAKRESERRAYEKAQESVARKHLEETAKLNEANLVRRRAQIVQDDFQGVVQQVYPELPVTNYRGLQQALVGIEGAEAARASYRGGLRQLEAIMPNVQIGGTRQIGVLPNGQPIMERVATPLGEAFDQLSAKGHLAFGTKGLSEKAKDEAVAVYRDLQTKIHDALPPQGQQVMGEIQSEYRRRMALRDLADDTGLLADNQFTVEKAQKGLSDSSIRTRLQTRFGQPAVDYLDRIFGVGTGEGLGLSTSRPIVP